MNNKCNFKHVISNTSNKKRCIVAELRRRRRRLEDAKKIPPLGVWARSAWLKIDTLKKYIFARVAACY
jgi:hypothetical protein